MSKRPYRISILAGDGVGKETIPEGVRVLEAAAACFGFTIEQRWHNFGSCDYYAAHGRMMPDDWTEQLGSCDAIFFGAVGCPDRVPDHISLWGSIIAIRRAFDQYINLRPVRTIPGVVSPLSAERARDIDMYIVRENTEGEYSSVGGRMYAGTEREVVMQQSVMSRIGVDRVLNYAFELSKTRPAHHVTSATKSNGMAITMPFWDERVAAAAERFPEIRVDQYHIDALAAAFVLHPGRFDVVVASNLFGDILSDLGPACAGTIAIAPSANINPERCFPSLFEPVHGSAPDIAGHGIANPVGQIWSAAMMLDHLGEAEAAMAIVDAISHVLPAESARTRDMGGTASTLQCGKAIAGAIG